MLSSLSIGGLRLWVLLDLPVVDSVGEGQRLSVSDRLDRLDISTELFRAD